MPGPTTKPTDRERAAILALASGYLPDWKTAYIAADEKPSKEIETYSALTSNVSHWKNSAKVQRIWEDAQRFLAIRDQRNRDQASEEERTKIEREKGTEDNERTSSQEKRANVDYYDPANQRKQINRIIAESSDDPKTQLDAIKAIQQTQRDDRQAAKDSQIQRFYSPVQCRDCIIKANFAKLRRRLQAQEAQPDDGDNTI